MMLPPYPTQQSALISVILRKACSVQTTQNLLKLLIQVFGIFAAQYLLSTFFKYANCCSNPTGL